MFNTGNEIFELTTLGLIRSISKGLCVGYYKKQMKFYLKRAKVREVIIPFNTIKITQCNLMD